MADNTNKKSANFGYADTPTDNWDLAFGKFIEDEAGLIRAVINQPTGVIAVCDYCRRDIPLSNDLTLQGKAQELNRQGWRVSQNSRRVACPECSKLKTPPQPKTVIDKINVESVGANPDGSMGISGTIEQSHQEVVGLPCQNCGEKLFTICPPKQLRCNNCGQMRETII